MYIDMAEQNTERMICANDGVDIRELKARTKWSADEETALISAVLGREDVLFWDFKGPGGKSGVAKWRQDWKEIADVLNA